MEYETSFLTKPRASPSNIKPDLVTSAVGSDPFPFPPDLRLKVVEHGTTIIMFAGL